MEEKGMVENRNLFDYLSSVMVEYLSLKADSYKKKAISGMSVVLGRVLSFAVLFMVLMLVLGVLAVALVMAIGNAVGSMVCGALIVAGIYAFVFILLFCFRKKMFVGMFARALDDGIRNMEM